MKKAIIPLMIITLFLSGCNKPIVPQLDTSKKIYNTFSNMQGYEAVIKLSVFSNNTNNTYDIQQYYKYPDKMRSETGSIVTVVNGDNVAVKNAQATAPLMLQQLSEENDYMFLNNFFAAYYKNEETTASVASDNSNIVKLEMDTGLSNPYKSTARLTVNTDNMQPLSMEILGKDGKAYIKIEYLSFKITDVADDLFVI